MEATTSGRFRVLESPRDEGELVFVDVETYEPTYVATPERTAEEEDDGDDRGAFLRGVRPGYVVDATLGWREGTARVVEATLVGRSLVSIVDDVTGLFEVARETCRAAAAAGEPFESTGTYDTDGGPNGVLYAFADEGASDTFDAFRRGDVPLEPLLRRVEERRDEPAAEAFLMRPVDEPFVLFYVAFRKGGVLADTVRDTYDCPRPDEPLVADANGADSADDADETRGAEGDAVGGSNATAEAFRESARSASEDGAPEDDPWDEDAWLNGEESDPWRES